MQYQNFQSKLESITFATYEDITFYAETLGDHDTYHQLARDFRFSLDADRGREQD